MTCVYFLVCTIAPLSPPLNHEHPEHEHQERRNEVSVYVDQISIWPTTIRCFKGGSCHMIADSLDELHAFARKIGLRKGWFQQGRMPHYDLTPKRRVVAVQMGAIELTRRQYIEKMHERERQSP
jgi:Protein of unknown function (DUF4031)